jgi:hypothetical protein
MRQKAKMKKLNFLISLTTDHDDYRQQQANAAQQAARGSGVDVKIIYAQNGFHHPEPATAYLDPIARAPSGGNYF